jgi:hypothetical protein
MTTGEIGKELPERLNKKMQPTYIYHVASPSWFTNGTDRLCLRQYLPPPPHEPYRNHQPLNSAMDANPEQHVFAAFFFSDEDTAVQTAFDVLMPPRVVLRVLCSDPALVHLTVADDDCDRTQGAHMRFASDSCEPSQIAKDYAVHPSWGIPFDRIDVKLGKEEPWRSMRDYVNALSNKSGNSADKNSLDHSSVGQGSDEMDAKPGYKLYRVYEHPLLERQIVKDGFSWPATLIGPFWFLWKKLWVHTGVAAAILCIGRYLIYQDVEPYDVEAVNTATMYEAVLFLLINMGIGLFANDAWEKDLQKRGFDLAHSINARSLDEALATIARQSA